jgi:hypothetical protein
MDKGASVAVAFAVGVVVGACVGIRLLLAFSPHKAPPHERRPGRYE